jgi:thioesterase domain-containing protein/acyl carrier protein
VLPMAPATQSHPLPAPFKETKALPLDPVERALSELYAELLGVEDAGVHDNFFDLGGNSLIGFGLRSRIDERLGVKLPVHALIEFPTIRALAARIRSELPEGEPRVEAVAAAPAPSLLLMKDDASDARRLSVTLADPRNGARPLFLIQPLGGTVYSYLPLARLLGVSVPVIGLRASGLEPEEPVFASVEAMAASAIEALRAIQPAGPYRIGGHSAGGVVAFEAARQLMARGEAVELLAMLDVYPPHHGRQVKLESAADFLDIMQGAIDAQGSQASHAYGELVKAFEPSSPFASVVLASWRAILAYEPPTLDVNAVFVGATVGRDPKDLPEPYWLERLEGSFTRVRVQADHFTMLDAPKVTVTARAVQRALDALESENNVRLSPPLERVGDAALQRTFRDNTTEIRINIDKRLSDLGLDARQHDLGAE